MAQQANALQTAITAVTTTTAGGAFSIENDSDSDRIITRCVLHVTTAATGAATLDVGVDDAGDTSSDTLLDGVDVGTAAGIFDNIDDQGTNGNSTVSWPSGEYVVGTASATLAGLVGYVYLEYINIPAE